jgi:hypothetical protein
MMPAARPDHREFVSDLNNVLTLLQVTDVYLLSSPPEVSDAWPTERTMLVWKDVANAWQFKIPLLGEQHQGAFDTQLDNHIIQCLETLEINPYASEEISADLGENLLAHITRPCLRLTLDQQNKVIEVLNGSWLLSTERNNDRNIQLCLALLSAETLELTDPEREDVDEFKNYLTLDRINVLYGASEAHINNFLSTKETTTLADILRFVQLLALASVRKLGHPDAVALPALPQGSEVVYGSRPRPVENNVNVNIERVQALMFEVAALRGRILTVEMQAAINDFETTLTNLEVSVPNLSGEDRERLTQSLDALRTAKTAWVNSDIKMEHLLTFRRATDEVLQAEHIQRLYTHQRLGVFGGCVESQELKNLRLSLRGLRDFSRVRAKALKGMQEDKYFLLLILVAALVLSLEGLNLIGIGLMVVSAHYGLILGQFVLETFLENDYSFSYDAWSTQIEASRELFTNELPQAFAAVVAISACYGLLVGEFSAAAGMLATAGMAFSTMFLAMVVIPIVIFSLVAVGYVGYVGYQAASQLAGMMSEYVEDWRYGFNDVAPAENNRPEVILELEQEGIGLAPGL